MQNDRSLGRALAALAPLVFASVSAAQVGTLERSQRIAEGEGGFTGQIAPFTGFGTSAVSLGDVNGDGIPDLAVGHDLDGDGGPGRGAVWILFMTRNGTVASQTKISQTQGGFTGTLPDSVRFGRVLAAIGDLDDDGVPDLAVTSGGCPGPRPRMWILFLNSDGTVREHTETVLYLDPAFVPTPEGCDFESGGLAALGDVNGDGVEDLAIGAPQDDDGAGANRGAVWIARMNADGTIASTQKISQTMGGLTSELTIDGNFGGLISNLGDRDSDGNVEIGVTASSFQPYRILFLDDMQHVRDVAPIGITEIFSVFGDGGGLSLSQHAIGDVDRDGAIDLGVGRSGGAGLMFVSPEGQLRKALVISGESIGYAPQSFPGLRGAAGDLDGDGTQELIAVDPGSSGGGIFILFIKADPVRNGSGVNPLTLKGGDTVLGETWGARLNCSANGAGVAMLTGWSDAQDGLFLGAGELLVGGQRLFVRSAAHASEVIDFLENLPADPALVNLPLHVQGLCTGAPGPQLSNALDFLVGF